MASRKGLAPQVMAYWLMSASMAWTAALFRTAGAGKSGKPCARLMAPCRTARRVISRITDSVNWAIRRLRNRERGSVALVGTIRGYCAGGAAGKRGLEGDRGQTGLPANFRQTAPEIHGSLVSPPVNRRSR